MAKGSNNLNITVKNCPRCKQEHWLELFYPFMHKTREVSHWATCPESKEPILLRVKEEGVSFV